MDLLLGMLSFQTIDQVQFGTDRPLSSSRRLLDGLNDLAGRTRNVSDIVDFAWALRMHQDLDPRYALAELSYVSSREHLVHATVPLP